MIALLAFHSVMLPAVFRSTSTGEATAKGARPRTAIAKSHDGNGGWSRLWGDGERFLRWIPFRGRRWGAGGPRQGSLFDQVEDPWVPARIRAVIHGASIEPGRTARRPVLTGRLNAASPPGNREAWTEPMGATNVARGLRRRPQRERGTHRDRSVLVSDHATDVGGGLATSGSDVGFLSEPGIRGAHTLARKPRFGHRRGTSRRANETTRNGRATSSRVAPGPLSGRSSVAIPRNRTPSQAATGGGRPHAIVL